MFAIVMGSFVTLTVAGKDTDSYLRFLTLLVTTLVPSVISAVKATTAAKVANDARDDLQHVKDQLNGTLDKRIVNAVQKANGKDE